MDFLNVYIVIFLHFIYPQQVFTKIVIFHANFESSVTLFHNKIYKMRLKKEIKP